MLARGRSRYTDVSRQIDGSQVVTCEQRIQHGRARGIGEQRCYGTHVAAQHPETIHPDCSSGVEELST